MPSRSDIRGLDKLAAAGLSIGGQRIQAKATEDALAQQALTNQMAQDAAAAEKAYRDAENKLGRERISSENQTALRAAMVSTANSAADYMQARGIDPTSAMGQEVLKSFFTAAGLPTSQFGGGMNRKIPGGEFAAAPTRSQSLGQDIIGALTYGATLGTLKPKVGYYGPLKVQEPKNITVDRYSAPVLDQWNLFKEAPNPARLANLRATLNAQALNMAPKDVEAWDQTVRSAEQQLKLVTPGAAKALQYGGEALGLLGGGRLLAGGAKAGYEAGKAAEAAGTLGKTGKLGSTIGGALKGAFSRSASVPGASRMASLFGGGARAAAPVAGSLAPAGAAVAEGAGASSFVPSIGAAGRMAAGPAFIPGTAIPAAGGLPMEAMAGAQEAAQLSRLSKVPMAMLAGGGLATLAAARPEQASAQASQVNRLLTGTPAGSVAAKAIGTPAMRDFALGGITPQLARSLSGVPPTPANNAIKGMLMAPDSPFNAVDPYQVRAQSAKIEAKISNLQSRGPQAGGLSPQEADLYRSLLAERKRAVFFALTSPEAR